jgi:predicted AlkP superfamily pyrophosphatase or phosphodiesterase
MIKRLLPALVLLSILSSCADDNRDKGDNKNEHRPKLVVGIVIDQMRYDYLYKYAKKYGKGGFKRLMKEGFSFEDAQYNYVPTFTGPGHTAIYTGATPGMSGIVANDWYDRSLGKTVYCVQDDTVYTVGSFSKLGKMSPKRELVSTIGDALKLSNGGKSKVIGISQKDRAAILPAGHRANAAYWLDDSTGNWITSTYYMKFLPQWVMRFNQQERVKAYLSKPWYASLPLSEYTESMPDDNPYEKPFKTESAPIFPHNLPVLMDKNGGLGLIKATPFGDDITKDFAIETIKNEHLGKGDETDMLTISFSSTDYVGHQFGTESIELEDTYIRMDKDLDTLLTFLDNYIGKNNVLVFLTADHGAAVNAQYLMDLGVPAGYVDDNALLGKVNGYLNSRYGSEVAAEFVNQQFYIKMETPSVITKTPIEVNKDSVEEEIANIASQWPGVERAIPAYKLDGINKDMINKKILNGYMVSRSGDVIINLYPNWLIYAKTGTTHGAPYDYDAHVPLLFWGGEIQHGSSPKEEPITNIAPTISWLLHIPNPDGCMGQPMGEVGKK